jgi:hypothetical protein
VGLQETNLFFLRNITLEMFNHIIKVKEKEKHLIQFEYNTEHRGFYFYFLQTRHVTVNSIYIINR